MHSAKKLHITDLMQKCYKNLTISVASGEA